MKASAELTPVAAGANEGWWVVCNEDDPATFGWFKTIRKEYPPESSYAIGMERVAYALGVAIDLPVPPVELVAVDGRKGCVTIRAGGRHGLPLSWAESRAPVMSQAIRNENVWPLAVVFDVWIANIDRKGEHIILDPIPSDVPAREAKESTSWFIDHEKSGLWWPRKIDADAKVGLEVEKLKDVTAGEMTAEGNALLRNRMPLRFRSSFTRLPSSARDSLLEIVRTFVDDEIRSAVEEVPVDYMSKKAQELTITFLTARRDRLDTLVSNVFISAKER